MICTGCGIVALASNPEYNNEEVIIDGTIKVSNTWADDTIGGVQVEKIENFTNLTHAPVKSDDSLKFKNPLNQKTIKKQ